MLTHALQRMPPRVILGAILRQTAHFPMALPSMLISFSSLRRYFAADYFRLIGSMMAFVL